MLTLEERLTYIFHERRYLEEALTHRSYAHEQHPVARHNERLELLGDSVIGLVVARLLFEKWPEAEEGEISKRRSWLVSEPILARIAGELKLGEDLRLGKGEQQSGGTSKPRLLACALEALAGAVYLDGGFEAARQVVESWFASLLDSSQTDLQLGVDYKTQLQEMLQEHHRTLPQYEVVCEEGPAHNRQFHVQVRLQEEVLGEGIGRSKKAGEQKAAQAALQKLWERLGSVVK